MITTRNNPEGNPVITHYLYTLHTMFLSSFTKLAVGKASSFDGGQICS